MQMNFRFALWVWCSPSISCCPGHALLMEKVETEQHHVTTPKALLHSVCTVSYRSGPGVHTQGAGWQRSEAFLNTFQFILTPRYERQLTDIWSCPKCPWYLVLYKTPIRHLVHAKRPLIFTEPFELCRASIRHLVHAKSFLVFGHTWTCLNCQGRHLVHVKSSLISDPVQNH